MDKEKKIEDFYLESEACCTLLCTGDDGKKYVEFEDWERDVNKLQNIIKKLKQEKKQAVKEFAEKVKGLYPLPVRIDKELERYIRYKQAVDNLFKEFYGEEEETE